MNQRLLHKESILTMTEISLLIEHCIKRTTTTIIHIL
uniref:Uncharacterized protein n=1 Tax=Anguilla anguilla TaxID=7936 RepID=A0A0E9SWT0_ANGAN